MKKTVRFIVNLILCFLIALGLVLTLPKAAGITPYVVLSGSMEPTLHVGAAIFTDTREKSPSVGDIITFTVEDSLVTHRVKQVTENGYITKGDANETEDPEILPEQVQGIVLFSIPYLGYAAFFTQNKGFWLILAALVLLSFALEESNKPPKKKNVQKGEGRWASPKEEI